MLCILLIAFTPHAAADNDEVTLRQAVKSAVAESGDMSDAAHAAREELTEYYWDNRVVTFRFYRAAPYLQKMLSYYQQNDASKRDIVRTRFRLGKALRIQGNFSEALPHLEFVYGLWRNRFGEDHRKTFFVMYDLSICYLNLGQLDKALQYLEIVTQGFENEFHDEHPRVALAYLAQAFAYFNRNELSTAKKFARDAKDIFELRKSAQFVHTNRALFLLAKIAKREGKLQKAERILQKAIANYSKNQNVKGTPVMGGLVTLLARVMFAQGRLEDALGLMEKAVVEVINELGENNKRTVKLRTFTSAMLMNNNRLEPALEQIKAALDALVTLNDTDSIEYARALRIHTQINTRLRRLDVAQASLQKAAALLERFSYDLSFTHPMYYTMGAFYLASKDYKKAEEILVEGLQKMDRDLGKLDPLALRMLTRIAIAQTRQEKYAQAIQSYRDLMDRSSVFLSHRFSQSKRGRKQQEEVIYSNLEKYLSLLARASQSAADLPIDVGAESFRVAENMRNRSLQSALLGMAARAATDDENLAELIRTEQDVRKQLGDIEESILSTITAFSGQANRETKRYVVRRTKLLRQLNQLEKDIAQNFPQYQRLVNPTLANISDVQQLLGKDEVMLSFMTHKDMTMLWAISNESFETHVIDLTNEDIARKVGQLRKSLDVPVSYISEIPAFNVKLSYELFEKLIKPASGIYAKAKHIIVVPHAAMFSMPFGALLQKPVELSRKEKSTPFSQYKKMPWLASDYAMSIMPSATALVTLRKFNKQSEAQRSFIGFGDPQFSTASDTASQAVSQRGVPVLQRALLNTRDISRLPNLPETSDELRNIARALDASNDEGEALYLREKATETNVRSRALNDYRVVAFATHGLVAGDLDGLVQPALALTPPASPSEEDDGLLEMGEVLGLKLNADWVILSACNTASSDGSLTGGGLTGLTQAFFYAGSRAMLVSLWPVESTSTQLLTTSIFDNGKGLKLHQRAAALQVARQRLLQGKGFQKNGKELFSYAHPIFWAAFMLVGEGAQQ